MAVVGAHASCGCCASRSGRGAALARCPRLPRETGRRRPSSRRFGDGRLVSVGLLAPFTGWETCGVLFARRVRASFAGWLAFRIRCGARWMLLACLRIQGQAKCPSAGHFEDEIILGGIQHYRRPFSMILTSGPREILAMKPAAACCRHRRVIAERRQDQRRSFVPSQRGGCDAEEAQLRSKNRLFLELVVTNPIVAGDHDPPLRSRLREPHDVLGGLRKKLVVHTDVESSGAKGFRNLLTARASDR